MIKRVSNPEIAIVGGVIAGIALRVGIPTWILRVIFIASLFFTAFTSLILYFILWVVMPSEYISKEEFDVGVGMHPENQPVKTAKQGYEDTLKTNNKVASEGEELTSGQTHVETRDENGNILLERKRFSAK